MEIKIAETQAEFFGLIQLRKEVFVNQQQVDVNIEMDDEDLSAMHFVIRQDQQVIGTCRLVYHDDQAKLGRMAIATAYRHQHLGTQLLRYAEDQARRHGTSKIIIAAQLQALGFYLINGYSIISDSFIEADIEHKLVEKVL